MVLFSPMHANSSRLDFDNFAGGRPTSRALQQAVESPAEELILLDLSVLGPAAEGPAAELLLARGE